MRRAPEANRGTRTLVVSEADAGDEVVRKRRVRDQRPGETTGVEPVDQQPRRLPFRRVAEELDVFDGRQRTGVDCRSTADAPGSRPRRSYGSSGCAASLRRRGPRAAPLRLRRRRRGRCPGRCALKREARVVRNREAAARAHRGQRDHVAIDRLAEERVQLPAVTCGDGRRMELRRPDIDAWRRAELWPYCRRWPP